MNTDENMIWEMKDYEKGVIVPVGIGYADVGIPAGTAGDGRGGI